MTVPGEHRETGRVLLSNAAGKFLFLKTHFDPEVGLPPRWITPGGGIEPGEDPATTAARELFEETGLAVRPEDLPLKLAEFSGRWDWGDGVNFHTYTDHFFEFQVSDFVLDFSGWTAEELRDVLEVKWWSKEELASSEDLFSPPGLVEFILNR